jgi:hypothetical protein
MFDEEEKGNVERSVIANPDVLYLPSGREATPLVQAGRDEAIPLFFDLPCSSQCF